MGYEPGSLVTRCTECKREFARVAASACEGCGTTRATGRAWVDFSGAHDAASARVRIALDGEFNDQQRDGHLEIVLLFTERQTWKVDHARTYPEPAPTPDTTDPGLDARLRVIEVLTQAGLKAE